MAASQATDQRSPGVDGMNIVLIGPGRVGRPLAQALAEAGHQVRVLGRAETAAGEHYELGAADLAFLVVPDQALVELAQQVVTYPRLGLVHCSGQLPNSNIGPQVAMFHPLMSFGGAESGAIFQGCPVGISGPDQVRAALFSLAEQLGARPFALEEGAKGSYHLAAMFASVFPYILLLQAKELAEKSGIAASDASIIFGPIFRRAVRHLEEGDPRQGLTGPVSRGDGQTVRRHLELLAGDPDQAELYRHLTRLSLRYARLDPGTRESLEQALQA